MPSDLFGHRRYGSAIHGPDTEDRDEGRTTMQDMDDYDRRQAGRLRSFTTGEFDPVRHGFDSDMTPDELRAWQAAFDAEIAQRQAPPRESAWTLWGIPLLLTLGVLAYAMLWAWVAA